MRERVLHYQMDTLQICRQQQQPLEQLDHNNNMFFDVDIADFTHCDTFLADDILDNDEQLHFDDRISISTRCRCSCSCLK